MHKPGRSNDESKDVPEEFYAELEELRKSLLQPYLEALEPRSVRKDRILHWLLRKMMLHVEDIATLSQSGVMLVGNAAHIEPIVGGWGANAALLDAVAVAEHVKTHGMGNVEEYYKRNQQRWQDSIAQSEKRLEEMHGLAEPSSNL